MLANNETGIIQVLTGSDHTLHWGPTLCAALFVYYDDQFSAVYMCVCDFFIDAIWCMIYNICTTSHAVHFLLSSVSSCHDILSSLWVCNCSHECFCISCTVIVFSSRIQNHFNDFFRLSCISCFFFVWYLHLFQFRVSPKLFVRYCTPCSYLDVSVNFISMFTCLRFTCWRCWFCVSLLSCAVVQLKFYVACWWKHLFCTVYEHQLCILQPHFLPTIFIRFYVYYCTIFVISK